GGLVAGVARHPGRGAPPPAAPAGCTSSCPSRGRSWATPPPIPVGPRPRRSACRGPRSPGCTPRPAPLLGGHTTAANTRPPDAGKRSQGSRPERVRLRLGRSPGVVAQCVLHKYLVTALAGVTIKEWQLRAA